MEATSIPTLFSSLSIPPNHTTVGLSNLLSANSQIKSLFHHKRLPDVGWSDVQIQRLLFELSCLDTNCEESVKTQLAATNGTNTSSSSGSYPHRWTGAGEREGRIYSTLVSYRETDDRHRPSSKCACIPHRRISYARRARDTRRCA